LLSLIGVGWRGHDEIATVRRDGLKDCGRIALQDRIANLPLRQHRRHDVDEYSERRLTLGGVLTTCCQCDADSESIREVAPNQSSAPRAGVMTHVIIHAEAADGFVAAFTTHRDRSRARSPSGDHRQQVGDVDQIIADRRSCRRDVGRAIAGIGARAPRGDHRQQVRHIHQTISRWQRRDVWQTGVDGLRTIARPEAALQAEPAAREGGPGIAPAEVPPPPSIVNESMANEPGAASWAAQASVSEPAIPKAYEARRAWLIGKVLSRSHPPL
jgi:hypothetical protein